MCPQILAIGQFVIGAVGAVAGFVQQDNQARAQNEYNAMARQETIRSTMDQYGAIQNKMYGDSVAASNSLLENDFKAAEAKGTALNTAGEAGVGGASIASLIDDYDSRAGRYDSNIMKNMDINKSYLMSEERSTQYQAQGQINQYQDVARPSFLDAGLRIVGAGIDAYSNYKKWTSPVPSYGGYGPQPMVQ